MQDNMHLHYRYNIVYPLGILVAVIIGLMTANLGGIPELTNLISFGLTLTSLFLALIAIIYSIVSNTGFSKHVGNLQAAAVEISRASSSLSDITADLASNVAALPEAIEELGTKVETGQKKVLEKFEQMSRSTQTVLEASQELNQALLLRFLAVTSLSGLFSLYMCRLAYQTRSAFSLSDLTTKVPVTSKDYVWGHLVACVGLGIIEVNEKDGIWNVIGIHKDMPDLYQLVTERINEIFPIEKDPSGNENGMRYLTMAAEYFQVPPP